MLELKNLYVMALDPTGHLNNEKFAELILTECMSICEEVQADYLKHRRNTSDFEEKNIYAEGEAAADTIKFKINRLFGAK